MELTFDNFWGLYPRKQDKKYAEKCFNRLSKKKQQKAINDDLEARYKNTPKQFIPMASKYLNRERWEDEIIKLENQIIFPQRGNVDAWVKFATSHGISTKPGEPQHVFEARVKEHFLKLHG